MLRGIFGCFHHMGQFFNRSDLDPGVKDDPHQECECQPGRTNGLAITSHVRQRPPRLKTFCVTRGRDIPGDLADDFTAFDKDDIGGQNQLTIVDVVPGAAVRLAQGAELFNRGVVVSQRAARHRGSLSFAEHSFDACQVLVKPGHPEVGALADGHIPRLCVTNVGQGVGRRIQLLNHCVFRRAIAIDALFKLIGLKEGATNGETSNQKQHEKATLVQHWTLL